MGAALPNLAEEEAQGENLGGREKLTRDKIKKNHGPLWIHLEEPQAQHPRDEGGGAGNFVAHDVDKRSPGPQALSRRGQFLVLLQTTTGEPQEATATQQNATRLGDQVPLKCCSKGMLQIGLEYLHSVIWGQNSKSKHDSLVDVKRAVAQAVSRFNQDMVKTSMAVSEQLGYCTALLLHFSRFAGTSRRTSKADKDHMEREKLRRMAKRHKPDKDSCEPGHAHPKKLE
ncbi:hypothetical protein HPB47_009877 [Ixodes persulcatus]|uniref:Uncharacterized protein n=1 Tax=Ixodes persulcatus TaxID=34615 RepID=A0AC60P0P7_IXOPE|nr:hypothetical protein HPB47_009877 [Ixodes persulcatus]